MRFYLINIHSINKKKENYIKNNYPIRYLNASKYKNHDDYLRSIGAYLLLDKALGKFDESLIQYSKKGKPSIPNYPYFNYSHSGNYVALIVDKKHEVGIDIQIFKNKDRNYIKEWTKKEAVLKLTGEGISLHGDIPTTYKNKIIHTKIKRITKNFVITFAYS